MTNNSEYEKGWQNGYGCGFAEAKHEVHVTEESERDKAFMEVLEYVDAISDSGTFWPECSNKILGWLDAKIGE